MTDVVADAWSSPAPSAAESTFLDALVVRMSAEYGAAAEEVHARAVEILRGFAGARVQSFVPILVEKKLRESCRKLRQGALPDGPG